MTEYTQSHPTDQRDDSTDRPVHRTSFDPETDRPSEELVCSVSAVADTEPDELPVFSDVVDPDAIDSLFRAHADRARPDGELEVEFEYGGFHIRVSGDGHITLHPDPPSRGA